MVSMSIGLGPARAFSEAYCTNDLYFLSLKNGTIDPYRSNFLNFN